MGDDALTEKVSRERSCRSFGLFGWNVEFATFLIIPVRNREFPVSTRHGVFWGFGPCHGVSLYEILFYFRLIFVCVNVLRGAVSFVGSSAYAFHMTEAFPTEGEGEKITHEQVVDLLKENPSELAPYLAYREQLIEELPKNARGSLLLTLKLAEVCIAAGFYQAASEDLEAAIMQVSTDDGIEREEKDDMLTQLYDKLDALPPLS